MKRALVVATSLAVLLVMTVRTDAGISISISFSPSGPRRFNSWRPNPASPGAARVVVHQPAPVVVHHPTPVVVYQPTPVVVQQPPTVVVYRQAPVVVYEPAPVVVRRGVTHLAYRSFHGRPAYHRRSGVNVHGRWRYTPMRTRHGATRYRRIFAHR